MVTAGMFNALWQAAAAAQASPQIPSGGVTGALVVKNPVPGTVGRMFQIAFNMPRWVQWGGIVIAVVVGLYVLRVLYLRRAEISAWLSQRSTGYKIGLVGILAVMLLGAGGVGYAGNHYMQHNNDFCVGCHVMGDAWGAFQRSEHRKLECHACHRQSIFASARQLYFWIAEKPQDIPVHAKVPTRICSECHVQSDADSSWKRVVATAGHRLHLKSDSASLKGKVECVTCHGQEVHEFKSVDKTCGQSGCHAAKDTKIVLGAMAGQTSQHCTGCHTFSRVVPENISMDSTRKFLLANGTADSCLGCHEMNVRMKNFSPQSDRGHNGVCGTCHNPHTQKQPKDAYQSCAASGCHTDLEKRGQFHTGLAKHTTASCGECHTAHEWKAVGRECIDCHKNIFTRESPPASRAGASSSGESAPLHPIAWDRSASPRRTGREVTHRGGVRRPRVTSGRRVRHVVLQRPVRPAATSAPSTTLPGNAVDVVPKDNPAFSHRIHRVLACGGCHNQKTTHGTVTVRKADDCAACHHSSERSVTCEGCHSGKGKLEKVIMRPVAMRTSAETPARARTLPFAHRTHRDLACKGCHTAGTSMAVTRDCQSCHADHHVAERTCSTCHKPPKETHLREAHEGCAGSSCHTNAAVLALTPTRSVCLACHADQINHKPKRECAECHGGQWGASAPPPR